MAKNLKTVAGYGLSVVTTHTGRPISTSSRITGF